MEKNIIQILIDEKCSYLELHDAEAIAFKGINPKLLSSVIDGVSAWVVLNFFGRKELADELKCSLTGISASLDNALETASEIIAPLDKHTLAASEKGAGSCMAGIAGGAISGALQGGVYGPWGAAAGAVGGGLLGSIAGGCWEK